MAPGLIGCSMGGQTMGGQTMGGQNMGGQNILARGLDLDFMVSCLMTYLVRGTNV